jgi:RNA polymerase sigma-70 factor (ECF subfamily)
MTPTLPTVPHHDARPRISPLTDPALRPHDRPLEPKIPRPEPLEVAPDVVTRLQRGDPAALRDLVDCYGDRVFNACRRITGSHADAEDATQEVFLRVFEQAAKFRGDCRFGTWLLRVAVNHTINLCRSARRRRARPLHEVDPDTTPDLASAGPAPLESVVEREERRHLDEALQHLPDDQRAVIILREIEGLSYGEIAAVLELPVGTVNSRIVRGRQRLLEILRHRLPVSFPDQQG